MNWLLRRALRRAAKTYVKRLPGELAADWGGSKVYTVGQVRSAIGRLGLKGRYIGIAYAAFLTEADYLAIAGELPVALPYDTARKFFDDARPWGDAFSAQRDSETNTNATAPRTPGRGLG